MEAKTPHRKVKVGIVVSDKMEKSISVRVTRHAMHPVYGKRIIKSVAMDMVKLEKYQGVAASLSTVVTLFVSSMVGMPVSTSHCSTSAIMGVGASKSIKRVNWDIAKNMVMAWVLTFPCCGLIGFALAKLFMMF